MGGTHGCRMHGHLLVGAILPPQSVVDVVMSVEIGTDILGWIDKAAEAAELIVTTFAAATADINFARRPGTPAEDVADNIRWALQVASRTTAHGSLRLVPVMYTRGRGKFTELTGKEKLEVVLPRRGCPLDGSSTWGASRQNGRGNGPCWRSRCRAIIGADSSARRITS